MTGEEMMKQFELSEEGLDAPMSAEEIEALEEAAVAAKAIGTAMHMTWMAECAAGHAPDEDVSPGETGWRAGSAIRHAVHLLKKAAAE